MGERPPLFDSSVVDPCKLPALTDANATHECQRWDYARERFPETVISHFDLVCGRADWVPVTQSVFLFGDVVGSILSGLLADKFGRKWVIELSTMGYFFSGIGVIFAPDIGLLNLLRWCTSVCATAIYTASFTYSIEIVSGQWTTLAGVLFGICGALGVMCVPVLSWLFPRWTHLQLAITCPVILIFVLPLQFLFFPESPRWLVSQGLVEEAAMVNENIAAENGEDVKMRERNKNTTNTSSKCSPEDMSVSLLDLFKNPGICRSTLVLCFCFYSFVSIYNCLILDAKNLIPGKLFVNIEVLAGLEALAAVGTLPVLNYTPRRISVSLCILCTGACFLGSTFVEDRLLQQILAQVGQFSNTVNYLIMCVFSAEIFPTAIRSMGVGMCNAVGKFGASIMPLLLPTGDGEFTIMVFGFLTFGGGVLVLLLPETFNKELANTIEEGEQFNKKFGGLSFCEKYEDLEKAAILTQATNKQGSAGG